MAIDASVLSLFQTSGYTTDPLLAALYGGGAGSAGVASGIDPVTALNNAAKNETTQVAAVEKQPQVARDIAAFQAAVAGAKTPAALLANPAALKVLLTANGLGDQVGYTALAQKALLSDTSKTGSLASTLSDPQWLATAQTFDFANKGLSVLKNPAVLASVVNGYAEVTWRQGLDAATPGLSNALDFRARASTITSVDQILGDPTFRAVVTTALNIPEQIAFQPLEAQEKAVSSQVDISKFKNQAFVDQFTQRYLVASSTAASSSGGSSSGGSSITSLFA